MSERYALYFAPDATTSLWRFGSSVLGYDALRAADCTQIVPEGWTADDWRAATEDPRRYGFHATMKAPFALAPGAGEIDLIIALTTFCDGMRPVDLGACDVHLVGDRFVAITPVSPPPALAALEKAAVTTFEPFRAPLTEADRRRRRPESLSPRQRDYLDRFGYPYLFEEFRFHMTLTGALPNPAPVADALRALWHRHRDGETITVDTLSLFRQRDGGRFTIIASAPFRRD
jgi:hypothetical protein